MNAYENDQVENFTLTVLDCPNDHKTALKLHSQFAHPTSEKLLKLINSAGEKWSKNENLKREIKLVTVN